MLLVSLESHFLALFALERVKRKIRVTAFERNNLGSSSLRRFTPSQAFMAADIAAQGTPARKDEYPAGSPGMGGLDSLTTGGSSPGGLPETA